MPAVLLLRAQQERYLQQLLHRHRAPAVGVLQGPGRGTYRRGGGPGTAEEVPEEPATGKIKFAIIRALIINSRVRFICELY